MSFVGSAHSDTAQADSHRCSPSLRCTFGIAARIHVIPQVPSRGQEVPVTWARAKAAKASLAGQQQGQRYWEPSEIMSFIWPYSVRAMNEAPSSQPPFYFSCQVARPLIHRFI